MKSYINLASAVAVSCFISAVWSSPLSRRQAVVGDPTGPEINNANIPGQPVGPVGASGSIYGSEDLLGPDGNPVITTGAASGTTDVGPYSLVPNQAAEPTLGLYLDFSNSPNPQPIRGDNGATDPGPSNYFPPYK